MTAKVTLTATIPVAQYANLQPTFEVEAETHEEAMNKALKQMQDVWNRTAAKEQLKIRDLESAPALVGEPRRCWASGTYVNYEPITHTYSTEDGKAWLSGSAFAHRYKAEFPGGIIAKKIGDKHDVDPAHVLDMWSLNGEASSTLGTAVHLALELRGRYSELSKKTKDGSLESATTKNTVLLPIVNKFFTPERELENARYEVFVADPVRAHCGLIDRLVIEEDGLYVEDYKTNTDLHKPEKIAAPFTKLIPNTKLGAYWLQLSFYGRILTTHGRTVKGLRIHHWDGDDWVTYEHPLIDLDAAFRRGNEGM